jgi:pimeloyl-ACP methyl ester carboxylesterase
MPVGTPPIKQRYLVMFIRHLCALAVLLVLLSKPDVAAEFSCSTGKIPEGFVSDTVKLRETTLHYVSGGRGPSLILLHGFPENWSAYAKIMPKLADKFFVVAVDLRGIGGSPPAPDGYDTPTMAEDIHQLIQSLQLEKPYVVGHDIGGAVAYALARLHPEALRGMMILDVPIAGVPPWDEIKNNPGLWHVGFHNAPGLAEKLLAGREAIYLDYFLHAWIADPKSITDEDVERYACAYAMPGRLEASMRMYRELDKSEAFGKRMKGPLDVPTVLVGGAAPGKGFAAVLPKQAQGLKESGLRSVAVETVANSGHYLVDEQPARLLALIETYATR